MAERVVGQMRRAAVGGSHHSFPSIGSIWITSQIQRQVPIKRRPVHIPVGNRGDPACRSWPRLPAPPAPPRPHPLLMESIIRRLASSFEPSTPSLCSICNICSCCRHHQGRCLLPATLGHYCRFERKLWHARRLHSPIDYTTSPPTPHPHPIGRLLSFSDYVCVCVCVCRPLLDGREAPDSWALTPPSALDLRKRWW